MLAVAAIAAPGCWPGSRPAAPNSTGTVLDRPSPAQAKPSMAAIGVATSRASARPAAASRRCRAPGSGAPAAAQPVAAEAAGRHRGREGGERGGRPCSGWRRDRRAARQHSSPGPRPRSSGPGTPGRRSPAPRGSAARNAGRRRRRRRGRAGGGAWRATPSPAAPAWPPATWAAGGSQPSSSAAGAGAEQAAEAEHAVQRGHDRLLQPGFDGHAMRVHGDVHDAVGGTQEAPELRPGRRGSAPAPRAAAQAQSSRPLTRVTGALPKRAISAPASQHRAPARRRPPPGAPCPAGPGPGPAAPGPAGYAAPSCRTRHR